MPFSAIFPGLMMAAIMMQMEGKSVPSELSSNPGADVQLLKLPSSFSSFSFLATVQ